MDTTLRDGEQTPDVAYTPAEKLQLARILLAEVGSTGSRSPRRASPRASARRARLIADGRARSGCSPRIEMLGYCDGAASVDWIAERRRRA